MSLGGWKPEADMDIIEVERADLTGTTLGEAVGDRPSRAPN